VHDSANEALEINSRDKAKRVFMGAFERELEILGTRHCNGTIKT
jgi:hypothetical protein